MQIVVSVFGFLNQPVLGKIRKVNVIPLQSIIQKAKKSHCTRYIYSGKNIYIKEITLKHSWSFAQKRFLRPGCPRALQGNWTTKKAKV